MEALAVQNAPVAEETLGERLRAARERMGLSQATLGDRVGVRGQTIYRYESGRMAPGADVLLKLASALDVSERWLQHGETESVELDADHPYPALGDFLATPLGGTVSPRELRVLQSYRASHGAPNVITYQHLLAAIRSESEDPSEAARVTGEALKSALSRGGKMLKEDT